MYAIISGIIGLLLILILGFVLVRGVWVKKTVRCPKDEWTTVISNFATAMPKDWNLSFKSTDNSPIAGEYREQKYFWLFPKTPQHGTLKEHMTFHRDWVNARYILKVKPTSDLVTSIQ